jgi:hypothetical protein
VIIDLCKQHGVWFDADELPKIIDFIDGGGLARAREKEKLSLDEQRSKLREEQRKLGMLERRTGTGGGGFLEPYSTAGSLISLLFDLDG